MRWAQHDGAGAPRARRPRALGEAGRDGGDVGEATRAMGSGGISTTGARGAVKDDAGRLPESVVSPRDACGGLSTTEPVPPGRVAPALWGRRAGTAGRSARRRARWALGVSRRADVMVSLHHNIIIHYTSFQLRMVLLARDVD